MPWLFQWEPNPTNPSLSVVDKKPELRDPLIFSSMLNEVEEISGWEGDEWVTYTHCDHCGGWVRASALSYPENTINGRMLSGRQGTVYACQRCGREIGFMGAYS